MSSFVWYKNLDISFFRFVTMHACDDRQTDGRTDFFLVLEINGVEILITQYYKGMIETARDKDTLLYKRMICNGVCSRRFHA